MKKPVVKPEPLESHFEGTEKELHDTLNAIYDLIVLVEKALVPAPKETE